MSASLRFLAVAVVGWAGLRAASLGMIPGAEAFTLGSGKIEPPSIAEAPVSAIVPTQFAPIDPPVPEPSQYSLQPGLPQLMAVGAMPPGAAYPIYYYLAGAPQQPRYYPASLPAPRESQLTPLAPDPAPLFYSPIPQLDDWPLSRMESTAMPARRSATAVPQQSLPEALAQDRVDRLQLTAWALLRGRPGESALASGGTLGGSQAGARLTYHVSPRIAASLRSTSPVGSRGGEIAAGVRVTPFRSIPVSLTAERRQAIRRYGGGRSAFALFIEGGVYQRPMPWNFNLDAYAQAGMVGLRNRDLFADGGFTLTRPLFGQFSAGFGMWGGVQPGVYRVDAGPRLSMRVRDNIRVHVDWRQRLAGRAYPPSGPALTLAGDF